MKGQQVSRTKWSRHKFSILCHSIRTFINKQRISLENKVPFLLPRSRSLKGCFHFSHHVPAFNLLFSTHSFSESKSCLEIHTTVVYFTVVIHEGLQFPCNVVIQRILFHLYYMLKSSEQPCSNAKIRDSSGLKQWNICAWHVTLEMVLSVSFTHVDNPNTTMCERHKYLFKRTCTDTKITKNS